MEKGYKFLIEKEEIWAKMLLELLKDNNIPYAVRKIYGAGLVMRAGKTERMQIYVPSECFRHASDLAGELFSNDNEN